MAAVEFHSQRKIDHDISVFWNRAKRMFSHLIPGITYGFAAAVSPGPLSMFLISRAVTTGWRRTLPAAFSPLISDGPVGVLVLAVLSQTPTGIVQYLRVFGGAFILYLAFGAWKSWRGFDARGALAGPSATNSLWEAAVVNWLNPNLYLGWGVILGPMVLSGWRRSPAQGVALVLGFYLTIIGTMIAMIVLFAAAGNLGPRIRKSLIGLSSIGLICLGIYQLWLGVAAFAKS